jgi:hypothetical protein
MQGKTAGSKGYVVWKSFVKLDEVLYLAMVFLTAVFQPS